MTMTTRCPSAPTLYKASKIMLSASWNNKTTISMYLSALGRQSCNESKKSCGWGWRPSSAFYVSRFEAMPCQATKEQSTLGFMILFCCCSFLTTFRSFWFTLISPTLIYQSFKKRAIKKLIENCSLWPSRADKITGQSLMVLTPYDAIISRSLLNSNRLRPSKLPLCLLCNTKSYQNAQAPTWLRINLIVV